MKVLFGRLRGLWMRWRVHHDLYEDKPEHHPALRSFQKGELLPWKGTTWRVADIRERPIPALILVPSGETLASKFQHLREIRRADRILSNEEAAARRRLARRAER
jgi:hypothetical protein